MYAANPPFIVVSFHGIMPQEMSTPLCCIIVTRGQPLFKIAIFILVNCLNFSYICKATYVFYCNIVDK